MNKVLLRGKDRWILAGIVASIVAAIVLIAATIDAGRDGVIRRNAWTEEASTLVRSLAADPAGIQIVDARSEAAYAGGHVRGALSLPASALMDEALGAALLWPDMAARIGQIGLDTQRETVVYAADAADAAYVVWALKAYGVEHVRLIAGGIRVLVDAGAPIHAGGDAPAGEPGVSPPAAVASVEAPDARYAMDLIDLYSADGQTLQLVDARAVRADEISVSGAARHHIPAPELVDGAGIKRSKIAVSKTMRSLDASPSVVYADDVREAALVWWALVSEGQDARLFTDGYALWQQSGMPTEAVVQPEERPMPAGMRLGGGCG